MTFPTAPASLDPAGVSSSTLVFWPGYGLPVFVPYNITFPKNRGVADVAASNSDATLFSSANIYSVGVSHSLPYTSESDGVLLHPSLSPISIRVVDRRFLSSLDGSRSHENVWNESDAYASLVFL